MERNFAENSRWLTREQSAGPPRPHGATADVAISVQGLNMPAYLARPESTEAAPAVILLPEIFGLNAEMRTIADMLAQTGYVALAVNYCHRSDPSLDLPYDEEGIAKGLTAVCKVTRETIDADIHAAVDWLNAQDFVRFNHVATWGLCFGGSIAFASSMLRGISASIVFYGGQIAKPLPSGGSPLSDDAEGVRAPLLLYYGAQDKTISLQEIESIERSLRSRRKRFAMHVYPEQEHGFFRQAIQNLRVKGYGTGFNDGAAFADSWHGVQDFLRTQLA